MAGSSGEERFLSLQSIIESVCRAVARRHRMNSSEAEDFASDVRLRLMANDYEVLTRFRGTCTARTYLAVVINRMLLDRRNAQWGKWRPPKAVRANGATAILLARLTMRDGFSFDEACEILETNHGITLSRSALWEMYRDCRPGPKRRFISDDSLESIATGAASPYQRLADREAQASAGRALALLGTLLRGLPFHERQLLESRFMRGLPIADIARLLRLEPKRLYRTFEQLLRRLRLALEEAGYHAEDVLGGIGAAQTVSQCAGQDRY
jgi:RNA polymerase sigma factor (sigma-70 family)